MILSRRHFLAMAAGRLAAPEWKKYPDPATELEVLRLTDPAFASGMTAPHLRQFTRRTDSLLYWSERFSDDSPGARQAFLLDLKMGESRQLTSAAALDPSSLALSADDRLIYFFDGASLMESPVANPKPTEIHRVPAGATRSGFSVGPDGAVLFAERLNGRTHLVSVLRRQARTILDTPDEIDEIEARPRHPQLLYRSGSQLFLLNSDGTGKRALKMEPGKSGSAIWIPTGRTLAYLHIPDNPKELVTLRENYPDENADRLIARTSQFISVSPNSDASVFTGASRSLANAYVLILVRTVRRELTLCEHRASDPAMVKPVFTPDSQNILFVSDRHGKPAVYQVHVARFVEETAPEPQ